MAKTEDLLDTLAEIFYLRKNKIYTTLDKNNAEDKAIRKKAALFIDKLNESDKSLAYYEYTFKECRDYIIDVLRKKNYSPEVPENKGTQDDPKYIKTKSTGLKNIPYELKILIWFMAYRAIEIYDSLADKSDADAKIRAFVKEIFGKNRRAMKGISNQLMLNIFLVDSQRASGYKFSKKTFQDFAMSPSRYYEAIHYTEIEMINTYAGEKKGYLGFALNYIVAFARNYGNFLDLFGGSGRATMVVPKIDGVSYYINEWNFTNINYYEVMKDDRLYYQFRNYIASRQKELKTIRDNDANKNKYLNRSQELYKLNERLFRCYEGKGYCIDCFENKLRAPKTKNASNSDKCKMCDELMTFSDDYRKSEEKCKATTCYKKCLNYLYATSCKNAFKYNIPDKSTIEILGKILLELKVNQQGSISQNKKYITEAISNGDSQLIEELNKLCTFYASGEKLDKNSCAERRKIMQHLECTYNFDLISVEKDYLREKLISKNVEEYRKLSDDDKIEWAFAFLYNNCYTGSGNVPMEAVSRDPAKVQRFIDFDLSSLDKAHKEFSRIRAIYNSDALYDLEFLIEDFSNRPPKMCEKYEWELRDLNSGKLQEPSKEAKELIRIFGDKTKEFSYKCKYRTLLYCDSPYLNTTGYGAGKGGSNKSGKADGSICASSMKELIHRLMNFYSKGNDFIFSCRAGISKNDSFLSGLDKKNEQEEAFGETLKSANISEVMDIIDTAKRSKETQNYYADCIDLSQSSADSVQVLIVKMIKIFANNYAIYDAVFTEFSKLVTKQMPLYVLVCLKDNLSLEQHLQKLDIIEVFVSTVKTPPIKQVYDKNGSYNFDVYSIREFLEILQENMLMSKYALNWKVDAYMDYSESKDPRYGKQRLTIHVPPEEINQKMKEGFSSPLTIA